MPGASPPTGRSIIAVEVAVSATAASPLSRAEAERLARAVLRAEGVKNAMLSIAFVGRRRIRSLNRRTFERAGETETGLEWRTSPAPVMWRKWSRTRKM